MKCYFHCDANMYRNRVRTFLEYTAVPVVFLAVFSTVCLLMSLRNLMHSQLFTPVAIIICTGLFAFALAARIMLEIAEHLVRVHSKYTYIEISLKDVIVSVYAGSMPQHGARTVLRRLVIIPLESFESAELTKKGQILIKAAKIRDYTGNTDRLGYHFKEGDLQFKEFFYREGGFTELSEVFIPKRFVNDDEIIESIVAAKERFTNLPPQKPYVFEEMSHVKTRKIRELTKRLRNV